MLAASLVHGCVCTMNISLIRIAWMKHTNELRIRTSYKDYVFEYFFVVSSLIATKICSTAADFRFKNSDFSPNDTFMLYF